jgi:hypothetical protein
MGMQHRFESHDSVTFVVGCFLLAAGFWIIFEFALHGVGAFVGGAGLFAFAMLQISRKVASVHNPLQVRRESKESQSKHLSS